MSTKAKSTKSAPKYATSGTYAELATKRLTASKVEGPCAIVWDLCEKMGPKAKRKDVVLAAVKKGVAFYTARTQYQAHRAAMLAQSHGKQTAKAK